MRACITTVDIGRTKILEEMVCRKDKVSSFHVYSVVKNDDIKIFRYFYGHFVRDGETTSNACC